MQVSERKINELTKKHISRLLRKMEDEFDAPYWLKQLVKKELWLFNQNLKEELFRNKVIKLDDKNKPWIPEKHFAGTEILCTPPSREEQV